MNQFFFFGIIAILIIQYLWNSYLDIRNAKHFSDPIPADLDGIYQEEEYQKSQAYKKTNFRFARYTDSFGLLCLLVFLLLGGFEYVDQLARSISDNPIWTGLAFFMILMLANDFLQLPFSYYRTFVIEEKFGFNKTTLPTFVLDKIKSWILMLVLGGILLGAIIWFYNQSGTNFWWQAWLLISGFSILANMFYSSWIVPLFNKQTPIEEGPLKEAITNYAKSVGFSVQKIMLIDGSKRSSKANAYFSGFGSQKQVTLYDTLVQNLEIEEIVAVLAHEIGHYKHHHIIYNLVLGSLQTALSLYVLSLLLQFPQLSTAIGVQQPSFHAALVTFSILYVPLSALTGLLMGSLSRSMEYQADAYAKNTYAAAPLINALKKLSKNSLSNLTPDHLYVKMHYSHPTLLQRIRKMKR
ncbi:MAG: M48 family metallopeptidase [Flavobacteriaceae bacterium]|nr:M48 family metallopeptidase [Flavobacteriaceae bacterium]